MAMGYALRVKLLLRKLFNIPRYLYFSFLRRSRSYRGGVGFNARMAELMGAFFPNSGNWQQMSKTVFVGVNRVPDQLNEIRAHWGGQSPATFKQTKFRDVAAELGRLFEEFGSDKHRNGYHSLYGELLGEALGSSDAEPIHVLEIGIGSQNPKVVSSMAWASSSNGGSLRAFAALSNRIVVLGLDYDRGSLFAEDRITTRFVDQLEAKTFDVALHGYENIAFDLIIDDGLHFITANLNSMYKLLPRLTAGGHMVIEDVPLRSKSLWEVVATQLRAVGIEIAFWHHGNGINVVIAAPKSVNVEMF
jgi:hypothetical protein